MFTFKYLNLHCAGIDFFFPLWCEAGVKVYLFFLYRQHTDLPPFIKKTVLSLLYRIITLSISKVTLIRQITFWTLHSFGQFVILQVLQKDEFYFFALTTCIALWSSQINKNEKPLAIFFYKFVSSAKSLCFYSICRTFT